MSKIRMKRLISFLLSIFLLFQNTSFITYGITPKDIKGISEEKSIRDWISKGYITIGKNNLFKPKAGITKIDFVSYVNKGYHLSTYSTENFKDIKNNDSYRKNFAIAKSYGYFLNDENGNVNPKRFLTREEFAFALYKIMGLDKPSTYENVQNFSENDMIEDRYKDGVEAVVLAGLMTGSKEAGFGATNYITRGEAIGLLDKGLHYKKLVISEKSTIEGKDIHGSVQINAPEVEMNHCTISGDLVLSKLVGEGNIIIRNSKIYGSLIVQGGGENSIHLADSYVNYLSVNKETGTVRVLSEGSTEIKNASVECACILEEAGLDGKGFGDLSVNSGATQKKIVLKGSFGDIQVNEKKVDLQFSENTTANSINLSKLSEGTTLVMSESALIKKALVKAGVSVSGSGTIEVLDKQSTKAQITVKVLKESKVVVKPTATPSKKPTVTPVPEVKPSATPTPTPLETGNTDATLTNSSKIKGLPVSNLGTPSATVEGVISGEITLPFDRAGNTTNIENYITSFEKGDKNAVIKVVKYGNGASTSTFKDDKAYSNEGINDKDFFLIRVTAANKYTVRYYRIIVSVKSIQIPMFDPLEKIDGGLKGNPKYRSVSQVISALPKTVTADGGRIKVPVKTWTNSDNYNAFKQGVYIFNAVLGDLPSGYTNENKYTASVKVVISLNGEIYTNNTIDYLAENPTLNIVLIGDSFDISNSMTSKNYWNVYTGSTGLTFSAVTGGATGASLSFSGVAREGTITIQAKETILVGGVISNTIEIKVPGPTRINSFDRISDISAGIAGNAKFKDAAAVQATLPKTATANARIITVPVKSWQNLDGYNPNVAGSYTFSAVLDTIPPKYVNSFGLTATVEVVVSPAGSLSANGSIQNGTVNPQVSIYLQNDTFQSVAADPSNWTILTSGTGLTVKTISKTGTNNVTIAFSGTALAGTISIQAKAAAMTGGAATNTLSISVSDPITITSFLSLSNRSAGIAGNALYGNAAAVVAALPTAVTANPFSVSVPVTTWTNTDSYNPSVAGSYTFTAVLGTIPVGYRNPNNYTATVEVVVSPPGVISSTGSINNGVLNPSTTVTLINDTFSSGAYNPGNWTINTGSTGLTISSISAGGTSATLTFSGQANTGTITVQANSGAMAGNVGTNTITVAVKSPVAIYSFDSIPNRSAGPAGSAIYSDANAVISTLPTTVTANGMAVTVPVIGWTDTSNYNPNVAGTYTFTAVLGEIPAGYTNSGNTAYIKIVVEKPAPTVITSFDVVPNISGGTVTAPSYPSAGAVVSALPTSITANGGAVTIPITTWISGDYNPAEAGTYTFTAVLGQIPSGFVNSNGLTVTVQVTILPAP